MCRGSKNQLVNDKYMDINMNENWIIDKTFNKVTNGYGPVYFEEFILILVINVK